MEDIMFAGKSIIHIFQMGGLAMYALLLCSILSVAVIINRLLFYHKQAKVKRVDFIETLENHLSRKDVAGARTLCTHTDSMFARIGHAALILHDKDEKMMSNAMEREITVQTIDLERYTSILGTIANITVYLGLLGTSLGIIRAFESIASVGYGGVGVVIGGVAEALIATATGLVIAVPAVVAYNYCVKRIDNFVREMELFSSEFLDMMGEHK